MLTERKTTSNSTYKKLAVQKLNEALCFVSSSVVADSFRLRNRQLLVAAKRYERFLSDILDTMKNILLPFEKNMKKLLALLIFALLISACSSEQKEKRKEEERIKEQEKTNDEQNKMNEINKLVSKYHIKYMWDTLAYEFSIKYKPVINSGYQLVDDVEVHDIYEKDSTVYALIKIGWWYPSFYFEFPISKEQENILTEPDSDILLVTDITAIQKIKFELNAEAEDSESAYLNIDNSDDFIGKGKIVDIVLIRKNKAK